jgi:hypothetical protein
MDGVLPNDQATLSLAELEAQITELAGHLNAANYRWLTLIAEFDQRLGWSDGALHSCAHWLNFKCGLDIGAAREKVRVAHALKDLPKIAAAMARGQLSYSKVRALTRVAGEGTEDYFLSIALHGTAHHVETLVRHYRRAKQAEELSREARQRANRSLWYRTDDDGSIVLKGRLPALAGAMLLKALDAAMEKSIDWEASPEQSVAAETSAGVALGRVTLDEEVQDEEASDEDTLDEVELIEPPPTRHARRADALALLAESFLQQGIPRLSTADRYQVVVHVDAETLRENAAGRCEIEQGPSLPAESARRLSCDASLVTIVENEQGEPLDVGRKTRSIPPAIRRALNARDRGCRFPGCTHQRYVDAHHIRHWAQGGETKVSNLVTLCRFHHRLMHEGGIVIQRLPDGTLNFNRPDGQAFERLSPNEKLSWRGTELAQVHDEQGIPIDCHTAVTRWCGERMDYGLAIQVLLQQAERARDVSAETFE